MKSRCRYNIETVSNELCDELTASVPHMISSRFDESALGNYYDFPLKSFEQSRVDRVSDDGESNANAEDLEIAKLASILRFDERPNRRSSEKTTKNDFEIVFEDKQILCKWLCAGYTDTEPQEFCAII